MVVYEPAGDFEPPVLTVSSPVDGARLSSSPEMVEVAYLDNGSGVDLSSLRIILDDLDLTSSCDVGSVAAACRMFVLQVGAHEIAAEVRDVAGNLASVGSSFAVVPPFAPPVVAINSPQPGALTNAESLVVGGQVFTVGTIAELEVNGQPTVLDGDRFELEIPVEEGFFLIAVRALDTEGRETVEQVEIVVDRTPPVLRLGAPSEQQLSNVAEIQVRGTAEDDLGLVEVSVQGTPVEVDVVSFEATVSLAEGANEITVTAIDPAGNATTRVVGATYEPSLSVTITEPIEQSHQITQTVAVRGSVAGEPTQVTVAGVPAELVGNAFSAQVPLSLGSNPIAVLARDAQGHVGKAVATVVRDATPPRIAFTAPLDGQKVFVPTLDVAGLVNDVIGTTVPAGQRFDVTINGVAARVEGETFVLEGITLQPGSNVLTAEVFDASGNRGTTAIMVDYAVLAVPRLLRVSGSGQAGTIGTRLPEVLVVRAVDESERPVGGVPVVFRVLEGSGQLDGGKRQALVFTDGGGHASIGFTLGTRAGLGNHVVEAGAVGFAGEARFLLEAQPGLPARLVVDTGDQQIGITGQRLPQPLVAIAVDSAFNPLPGVAVTLRVSAGEGYFENGLDVLELTTDAQGRAAASLVLGMQEGKANTAVVARLGRADEEPPADTPVAAFVASAMAVGSGATSIRGLVLDNTDQPVPGVTLRIAGTDLETTADAAGLFLLEDVPGGTLHLEVDGGTAVRPGAWPTLEFLLHPIPGRENVLPRPIFLLPLETEGLFVSETEGGILTLPELAGFELEIAPGSATFRDGSRSGTVAVTVVHADKVPMIPSFSQQPRLVITVQPPGTLFDPPARLTLPNLDGLAPGEVVDFFLLRPRSRSFREHRASAGDRRRHGDPLQAGLWDRRGRLALWEQSDGDGDASRVPGVRVLPRQHLPTHQAMPSLRRGRARQSLRR
ncbi:MAG: hypothetical protein HC897_02510 [Thermoanaerobaculia bacterium]|nr:hypothetical protein [Thermoanaerobaculia bacterium]